MGAGLLRCWVVESDAPTEDGVAVETGAVILSIAATGGIIEAAAAGVLTLIFAVLIIKPIEREPLRTLSLNFVASCAMSWSELFWLYEF
jgi:uncharacterized membrane protein